MKNHENSRDDALRALNKYTTPAVASSSVRSSTISNRGPSGVDQPSKASAWQDDYLTAMAAFASIEITEAENSSNRTTARSVANNYGTGSSDAGPSHSNGEKFRIEGNDALMPSEKGQIWRDNFRNGARIVRPKGAKDAYQGYTSSGNGSQARDSFLGSELSPEQCEHSNAYHDAASKNGYKGKGRVI
jgi:hypothetical protein